MNPSPNNPLLVHPAALENRFGLLVAARLSAGAWSSCAGLFSFVPRI